MELFFFFPIFRKSTFEKNNTPKKRAPPSKVSSRVAMANFGAGLGLSCFDLNISLLDRASPSRGDRSSSSLFFLSSQATHHNKFRYLRWPNLLRDAARKEEVEKSSFIPV